MTREMQLLLQCARRNPAAATIRGLARGGVDWPGFLALAQTHDLKSLAAWRLQQFCVEDLPAPILHELRTHFRRNTERNLMMAGELFRITDALTAGGVPSAAFKGPIYAWSIYELPGVREFLDLDLLVHPGHISRAKDVLRELGYRPETMLPGGAEAQFFDSGGQMEFIRENPSVTVDLHWDLAPHSMGLALDGATLWPRLAPVSIAGRTLLSFDAQCRLLLAAFHGGKHGWTTLAWLADMDAMIATHPMDWDVILAAARKSRLSRALFLSLRLANELLETPLPHEILRQARACSAAAALLTDAKSHLLHGGMDQSTAKQRMIPRKVMYQLRLTEGFLRQGLLLWRNITEPKITDSGLKVGSSLFGVYYVARPWRLALKYFRLLAVRAKQAVVGKIVRKIARKNARRSAA